MIRHIPRSFILLAHCVLAGAPVVAGGSPIPERAPIQLSREAQHVRLLLMDGAAAEAEQELLKFDPADPVASTLDAWVAMQRQEMMDPTFAFGMLRLRAEGLRDIRPIADIQSQFAAVVAAAPGLRPFVADVIYEAAAMELYDVLDEGRGVVLGDFTLYSNIALGSGFSSLPSYGVYSVRPETFPPDELLRESAEGPGFFSYADGFRLLAWARQQDPAVVDRWRSVYDDMALRFASAERYSSSIQTALSSGVMPKNILDWLLELLKFAEHRGPSHVRALQVAVATLFEASPGFVSSRMQTAPEQLAELFDGFRKATPALEFQAATECAGLEVLRQPRQTADGKMSGR